MISQIGPARSVFVYSTLFKATCLSTRLQKVPKPRALLLNKDKMVPLLWQVLSNKYGREIQFASHYDHKGKVYLSMGLNAGEKKASKVVIYPAGSTVPVLYEGLEAAPLPYSLCY
jgi:hypothetical protein